jgi:ribosomal protein L7/L12
MNYYAEAIGIITDPDTDFKALVIDIAKKHPKVIVDSRAKSSAEILELSWQAKVRSIAAANGSKIDAIKACRNMTDMGLKEAKDAVERLIPIWPTGQR